MDRYTFAPLAFTAGTWDDAPLTDPTPPTDVHILTWNVWFGGHMFDERRAALIAELARRAPDVIALQEVTEPLLDALLDEPWIRSRYQVSGLRLASYDVVILSRLPIRRLAEVALPSAMGRRLLIASLSCGLTVATVHLESMREEQEARATQLGLIQTALAAYPDVIFLGDMNFAPDAPLENAALDPSLLDTWAALHPSDPGFTVDPEINLMRAQVNSSTSRKRIDRIFARTPHWRARTISLLGTTPIDSETFISDHFGLEAHFTPS